MERYRMKRNGLFYFYSLSIKLSYYVYYYTIRTVGYGTYLFQLRARKNGSKTKNNVRTEYLFFYFLYNFCRTRRVNTIRLHSVHCHDVTRNTRKKSRIPII